MVLRLLIRFSYPAFFLLLVAAGVGVPLPEDITLLSGGYLAEQGVTSLWPTMILGYVGVVVGDLLIFRLGKKLGPGVYTHRRLGKLFTPKRRKWLEEHFEKRGVLTVVIGRHTPGLRAPTFLTAGASGMGTLKFFLADAASAVVTAPLVVYLGYFFAQNFEAAKHKLHHFELWAALGLLLVGLAVFVAHRLRAGRTAQPPRRIAL